MTAELERAGVMRQDMIVLSQFSLTLEGSDVSRSTISAYRGMEKPAVIVVAGFEMDDTTLACALGRATTCAYIIVPIDMLVGLRSVKSDFLRNGLKMMNRSVVLEKDSRNPAPRFIDNRVQKYAGLIGRHEIFGEGFVYASRWRRWIYEGGTRWNSRGAQLWGWWLSLSTGLPISGIDHARNEVTDGVLQNCAKCNNTTPHEMLGACLTCLATPLDAAKVSEIVLHAADLGSVRSTTRGNLSLRSQH